MRVEDFRAARPELRAREPGFFFDGDVGDARLRRDGDDSAQGALGEELLGALAPVLDSHLDQRQVGAVGRQGETASRPPAFRAAVYGAVAAAAGGAGAHAVALDVVDDAIARTKRDGVRVYVGSIGQLGDAATAEIVAVDLRRAGRRPSQHDEGRLAVDRAVVVVGEVEGDVGVGQTEGLAAGQRVLDLVPRQRNPRAASRRGQESGGAKACGERGAAADQRRAGGHETRSLMLAIRRAKFGRLRGDS